MKEKVFLGEKCKSITTDGAAAMTGSINNVVKKIEELSPECVLVHCILLRKALVAKKIKSGRNCKNDTTFAKILQEVVGIVYYIQSHAKKQYKSILKSSAFLHFTLKCICICSCICFKMHTNLKGS